MIAKSRPVPNKPDCFVYLDAENVSAAYILPRLKQELADLGDDLCLLAYGVPHAHQARYVEAGFTLPSTAVNPSRHKNFVDQQITIDAIEAALRYPAVSTFVIVSGDSDFVPLITKLQALGRRVVQIAGGPTVSRLLTRTADDTRRLPRKPDLAMLSQTPWPAHIGRELRELAERQYHPYGVNLADLGNVMWRKFGFSPTSEFGLRWQELCEILASACNWQVRAGHGVVRIVC